MTVCRVFLYVLSLPKETGEKTGSLLVNNFVYFTILAVLNLIMQYNNIISSCGGSACPRTVKSSPSVK